MNVFPCKGYICFSATKSFRISDTEVTLSTFTHTNIYQFTHPCKRSWSCPSSQFLHLGELPD